VRCERWDRALENHLMSGKTLHQDTWNNIINELSYGSPDASAASSHWWTTNVVIPCQTAAGMNLVARLEGSQTMAEPYARTSGSQSAKKIACADWNNGGCVNPCPNKERHSCSLCGKGHRESECHKASSMDNDSGKGHGGNKGHSKGSKGSKKSHNSGFRRY
jgi:hypothetical protein